jgi:hypothetical protein
VRDRESGGTGCAIVLLLIVIGLVVAALISLAALVDPFSWMPSVHRIWDDCTGDCTLAHRFPGFWAHALANLAWTVVAAAAAVVCVAAASNFRAARRERFNDLQAVERYRAARTALAWPALTLFLLAAAPVVVAAAR